MPGGGATGPSLTMQPLVVLMATLPFLTQALAAIFPGGGATGPAKTDCCGSATGKIRAAIATPTMTRRRNVLLNVNM